MKVTDKTGAGIVGIAGAAVKKTGLDKNVPEKASTATKENLGASATVDLSARAQDIKKAKEIASKGVSEVDEAKVAKFRALIDGGQYKIDAKSVADRLVDEHFSTLRAENGED